MQLILATLHCFYWPRFLTSLINRNWEARQKIQARLYWGPCCSREEQKQATVSLSCSLAPQRGQAGSLYGVTASCPGLGSEGWLRCFAHLSGGVECRGCCSVPCFCSQHPLLDLGSSEVAVGIWGLFASFVQSLPRLGMSTVIDLSRYKHCSKGSQVPACLKVTFQ